MRHIFRVGVFLLALMPPWAVGETPDGSPSGSWTFVSMPDFLNVDTDYPQPGWEAALDVILSGVKAEKPEFLLVAGDLVMGHWYTSKEITIRRGSGVSSITVCRSTRQSATTKWVTIHGPTGRRRWCRSTGNSSVAT